ncbi:hypothetical protein HOD30_01780 [Candidatus Peregrinibacteria bacterium]|jgi:hypothetical protein|nr:hypothetical protein [Candidatus Peregrinibacteria bacterium]MBT4632043.1 hypothetical protein [Candidatus Peregrinibacteria bacterium]MBT5824423.1 hypothetical protein [Candidatus Peregrinibacteria bacterium]
MQDANAHTVDEQEIIFPGEETFPTADIPVENPEILDADTGEVVEDTRDKVDETLEDSEATTETTIANTLWEVAKGAGVEKLGVAALEAKAVDALANMAIKEMKNNGGKRELIKQWRETVYLVDGGKNFMNKNGLVKTVGVESLKNNFIPGRQLYQAAKGVKNNAKLKLVDKGYLSTNWVNLNKDVSKFEQRLLAQTGVFQVEEALARQGDATLAKGVKLASLALAAANPKAGQTFNVLAGGLVRIMPRVRKKVGTAIEAMMTEGANDNDNWVDLAAA